MSELVVLGIDPGLVDTGVVRMFFNPQEKSYARDYHVFTALGTEVEPLVSWYDNAPGVTFIEAYRPRSAFTTDARMGTLVNDIRRAIPGSKTLLNQGAYSVVKQPLMEALDVWNFRWKTHHQDLRSAARIALFGMLKDPDMNRVIYDYITDYLAGNPWEMMKGDING